MQVSHMVSITCRGQDSEKDSFQDTREAERNIRNDTNATKHRDFQIKSSRLHRSGSCPEKESKENPAGRSISSDASFFTGTKRDGSLERQVP